jgi:hypothetical protein
MNSNLIVEEMIRRYNFNGYPEEYKFSLVNALDKIRGVFKDNLLSVTLGGSGGKNKIIDGWSDLDIYIILKRYDIEQISLLQEELDDSKIHIGLTFYSLYELENDLVDFKTKIMVYEKNNYDVNPTLYGLDYFKDVDYLEVYNNDMMNYPVVLQAFKRMYIEVLNNKRKIDKSYIKKMLVLLKCILSSHKIFAFGYDEVFRIFMGLLYNSEVNISFKDIIIDLEKNKDYIISISREIIEYTTYTDLFKKNDRNFKKRILGG